MNTNKYSLRRHINSMTFSDYGLALCKFVALVPLLTMFIMPVFNRIGLSDLNEAPAFYIALIGALMAGKKFFSQITLSEVLAFFLFAGLIYFSASIYPNSTHFVKEYYVTFVWMTIPFYFVGRTLNYERDKLLFVIFARTGFVLQLLYQVLAARGYFSLSDDIGDFGQEQMGIAYDFLFCVMFEMIYGVLQKSKIDLYLSLIGILLIFFLGARGPVVTLLFFVLVFYLFFNSFESYNKFKKVLIIAIGSVMYMYMTPLLLGLSFISQSIGLSSRVFDSILANELANYNESNGRDEIYDEMVEAISADTSGFGYGLGGDRLFTSHAYSHNFEIEILISFGIYIGGAFLLILALLFLKSFIKTKSTEEQVFLFVIFCFGFMPIQFSSTWINSPELFLLIGYCVSIMKQRKLRN